MSGGLTIHRRIHFATAERRKVLREKKDAIDPSRPPGRIPRVARLLALAMHVEHLVQTAVVPDYATLARLGHISRARLTQILNLTLLAPEIQEAILFLPPIQRGPDPIKERDLRPIAAEIDWQKQRRMWRQLLRRRPNDTPRKAGQLAP